LNVAVILISHDLNLVRHFAQRVCVMREGEIVEQAPVEEIFTRPGHDYTRHLLASQLTRMVGDPLAQASSTLLTGKQLQCRFSVRGGLLRRELAVINAVDGVDIAVVQGETLGIVGESGSGKSTLAHCLLRLRDCDGQIEFKGQRLDGMAPAALRPLRSQMQLVFQDPYSSLSPRLKVERIVGEGLLIHEPQLSRTERRKRVVDILREVGIAEDALSRYPHEFSGGQRQRIAVARAVILSPSLLILDEPTSALDASVQKQVLELLVELQRRRGLTYLLITHDLNVIRAVAHRVIVMKDGKTVETGPALDFLRAPQTDYGRTLVRASLIDIQ
ncbi:MAG TPA: ATP-binding cassette domain-containing protein, partial [candidate division Zixibacteria bacterium]|nr:ATP-binding cassette domain-containing protein [candidate division Zixibacteria bacterium]